MAVLAAVTALAAGPAVGQGITAQPLPPPGGTGVAPTGSLLARPPAGPAAGPAPAPSPAAKPVPSRALPTLAAPAPARKSASAANATPRTHPKPAAKPSARTVATPATKPGAKPPVAPPAKPASKPAAAAVAPVAPAAAVAPTPARPDPTKGSSTGLPLPRWVALRADEVNLRTGPGTQYPIDWVYHRRDYPMQVLREFEVWRLVQEQDGTKGWVHQATLTGRRGFLVTGSEQVLRAAAAETADPVARLMPGVVGHIRRCLSGSAWCEVQAGDYRGWLPRSGMYGVSPDEAIE